MKLRDFRVYFILLALFWLEVGFKKAFPTSFFVPQFVLVFAVIYAASAELNDVLRIGMIAGFLGELFSGQYFGAGLFAFLVSCLIAYFVSRSVVAQALSMSGSIMILLVIGAIFPLLVYTFGFIASGVNGAVTPSLRDYYSWQLIWRIVANLLIFLPLNRIIMHLTNEQKATF